MKSAVTTETPKVRVKAHIAGVKRHGPNSPDVIAGRVPLGHSEPIAFDEPEQHIEVTYDQAVAYFGQEKADELFKGGVRANGN